MTRALTIVFAAALIAGALPLNAQERFDSPEAAAQAVIDAADKHDSVRLEAIFGAVAEGVLTSGNSEQDRAEQAEFARLARAKHRIQIAAINPNRAILAIGDEDWPFPVPILRANGKWHFDAAEAPKEIQARRIGTDELDAVEICHGYVQAQKEYASAYREKEGMLQYAARLMSSPGRHDGLYWSNASDPLIPESMAKAESNDGQGAPVRPYHGYYFRILEGQGPNAPGGTHNYVAKGKLIGGFGLVAWPAQYGVTGVYTFIVNQLGIIYEKDIPPVPGQPTRLLSRFDPDPSWEPVD